MNEGSLVKECPLLLPQNTEKTVFDGFITVQERDYRIRILLPADHQLKRAKLQCSWPMKQLLCGYGHIVKQRLHRAPDLVSFMVELKTILEVAVKFRPEYNHPFIPPPLYYSQLITEMEAVGWDKLVSIDSEFRTLRLRAEDSSGRQHVVTVKLNPKHPVEAPECSTDLPVSLAITWTPQSSLGHIHSQFLLALASLAEFWVVLDEIDEKTWVLEPEKPSRADTMRRIAIDTDVSIRVEVDPRHPKMFPKYWLLGAEDGVTPLRKKLNGNMHLWNPGCSILQNLRDVLEIEFFPSPATHEKSSFSVECGMCFAYRLESDSAIPDQVCNHCGQPFHQACLYEWLRGLPESRKSFNIVYGECPFCRRPITVKKTTTQKA